MAQSKLADYLSKNVSNKFKPAELSAAVISELKFLRSEFDKGQAMSMSALQKWLKDEHGLSIGFRRLHSLAIKHGIKPWWRA